MRCKVEHACLIVKQQFGYCETAYRGIAKNMNRFHLLFASANLMMCARAGRTAEFCREGKCANIQEIIHNRGRILYNRRFNPDRSERTATIETEKMGS